MNANDDTLPSLDEQMSNVPTSAGLDERLDLEHGLACQVFSPDEEAEMEARYNEMVASTSMRIARGNVAVMDAVCGMLGRTA